MYLLDVNIFYTYTYITFILQKSFYSKNTVKQDYYIAGIKLQVTISVSHRFFPFSYDNESNAASNKDKYNRNGLIKLPLSHDFIVKRSVFNSILIHIPNKVRIEKLN